MDELLGHWDFLVALVVVVVGYADVRSTVKSSADRLDKFEDTVIKILERLESNDREDAVREEKLKELTIHKETSNKSKDSTIAKLNKIEGLVEQLIERDNERHKDYSKRFELIERKVFV